MTIGMRRPSVRRSIAARTRGRLTRAVKRSVIPGYGVRGTGIWKNPRRAVYNRIYKRTTFSFWSLFR